MEDQDLKELIVKLGAWLFVVVVFGSLMTIIFVNKFGSQEISINKKIDKKDSLVILVINNKVDNTKEIKNTLKKKNIKVEVVNKDKERYFNDFLRKLSITEKDIVEPTLIIVKEGKVTAILVEIKDLDELNSFLEYNT